MTETLSYPPLSFAACTRCWAARRRFVLTERSGDEASIVRLAGVGDRDVTQVDLVAQQRIVAREKLQRVVAQAVDARVADVPQSGTIVVEERQRERGAH